MWRLLIQEQGWRSTSQERKINLLSMTFVHTYTPLITALKLCTHARKGKAVSTAEERDEVDIWPSITHPLLAGRTRAKCMQRFRWLVLQISSLACIAPCDAAQDLRSARGRKLHSMLMGPPQAIDLSEVWYKDDITIIITPLTRTRTQKPEMQIRLVSRVDAHLRKKRPNPEKQSRFWK